MRVYTIIAFFIALIAVCVSAQGFHSSLHHQKHMYRTMAPQVGYANVTGAQLLDIFNQKLDTTYIVDVREEDEFKDGHIPGALNYPLSSIDKTYTLLPTKGKNLYVHCLGGVRSLKAIAILESKGVSVPIYNVQDGYNGWVAAGGPVERDTDPATIAVPTKTTQKTKLTSFDSFVESIYAMGIAQRPQQQKLQQKQEQKKSSFDSFVESIYAMGIAQRPQQKQQEKLQQQQQMKQTVDNDFESYLAAFNQQKQQPKQQDKTNQRVFADLSSYVAALNLF